MKIFGRKVEKWHIAMLMLIVYDAITICLSYFLALWFRFDCRYSEIPQEYLTAYTAFIPFYALFCVIVYFVLKLYFSVWRYASFTELTWCSIAWLITFSVHILGITLLLQRMPISYYLWGGLFQLMATVGGRFSHRFIVRQRKLLESRLTSNDAKIMIIGAGAAGQLILRDIQLSKNINGMPVCVIDDDPNRWGKIHGRSTYCRRQGRDPGKRGKIRRN